MAATLAGVAASLAVLFVTEAYAPTPIFETPQNPFLRRPVILSWSYVPDRKDAVVFYEVARGLSRDFKPETIGPKQDSRSYVDRDIQNGSAWWKVRAFVDDKPSGWSDAVETKAFTNAYSRIKTTKELQFLVSDSKEQGIFKFLYDGKFSGLEIDLATIVAEELGSHFGGKIKPSPRPIPWTDLLASIADHRSNADMGISTISKRHYREEDGVSFSEPYYCASQSLVFRLDQPEGSIIDMIRGKRVGYQAKTTSENIVIHLEKATNSGFRKVPYSEDAQMVDALARGNSPVDLIVTDTPFAISAVYQKGRREKIGYKKFSRGELKRLTISKDACLMIPRWADDPHRAVGSKGECLIIPNNEWAEAYAIAVHENEQELLNVINAVIAKIKKDENMLGLVSKAVDRYAKVKGLTDQEKGQLHPLFQSEACEHPNSEVLD